MDGDGRKKSKVEVEVPPGRCSEWSSGIEENV